MAILDLFIEKGFSKDGFTFRPRKDGKTIVSQKMDRRRPTYSVASMRNRLLMSNCMAMYRSVAGVLYLCFEECENRVEASRAYVHYNKGRNKVWLTKREVDNRACVVVPDQVSSGSLPTITQQMDDTGHLVTEILVADDVTTVGQLAASVVANNGAFGFGDRLLMLRLDQVEERGIPRVRFSQAELVLDTADNTLLATDVWRVADGRLGLAAPLDCGGVCVVHLGRKDAGKKRCSPQMLCCRNPLQGQHQGLEAFRRAVSSRGWPLERGLETTDSQL